MQPVPLTNTQKVAIVSLFTALALATDYAMLPLTNIKLMDTIVFVSSLVFGLSIGVSTGALIWLVYGSVNPYGSAFGLLLVVLILSETVYAFLGSLARRTFNPQKTDLASRSLYWGSLGLIGAFVYDLNTIITPAVIAGIPFEVAIVSLLPTIPFMLAHEISDFAFFAIAGPILVKAIFKVIKPRNIMIR